MANDQGLLLKWSKNRSPESPYFKKYCKIVSVSLQRWISAYQWAKTNKKVLKDIMNEDCQLFYLFLKSTNQPISTQLLSTYKEREWNWKT